jgi:hypothetical protein
MTCSDCGEDVPAKRLAALLLLYPPAPGGNPNLPSVPLRCMPCAEAAVKPFVASGSMDESGSDWVLDHVHEELAY